MDNDNLKLWDSVSKTDKKAKKNVKIGAREYTAIDPYWQIKEATKQWGAYGSTWGFNDIQLGFELIHKNLVTFKGQFFYPFGTFPIINAVHIMTSENIEKAKLDPDFAKKVETDALTKALSKLGYSADVFLSKFSDISDVKLENDSTDIIEKIKACETVAQVIQLYNKNKTQIDSNQSIKSVWSSKRQKLMEGKDD